MDRNAKREDDDEFARPWEMRSATQDAVPTFSQRLGRQLEQMPVFPIGMAGFLGIAAYGIYKYQSLPLNDSISRTVYFTRLRIMAQGFAVTCIAAGAAHAWYTDFAARRREKLENTH